MNELYPLIQQFLAKTARANPLQRQQQPVQRFERPNPSYTDAATCYLCGGCGYDVNFRAFPTCFPCQGQGLIFR